MEWRYIARAALGVTAVLPHSVKCQGYKYMPPYPAVFGYFFLFFLNTYFLGLGLYIIAWGVWYGKVWKSEDSLRGPVLSFDHGNKLEPSGLEVGAFIWRAVSLAQDIFLMSVLLASSNLWHLIRIWNTFNFLIFYIVHCCINTGWCLWIILRWFDGVFGIMKFTELERSE